MSDSDGLFPATENDQACAVNATVALIFDRHNHNSRATLIDDRASNNQLTPRPRAVLRSIKPE